jgi:dGTPase
MPMDWNQLLNEDRRRTTNRQRNELRTEFERDYDRSIFSTPVRRLQDKAQVFPLEPHDAVRTRLTHSLEVSTVARDVAGHVAEWLLNEKVIEVRQARSIPVIAATCGLIHDIGNPPFGHAGEQAISTWFCKQFPGKAGLENFANSFNVKDKSYDKEQMAKDFWYFEGNSQTLRLVSKLQVMDDLFGLNFTFGTLSALCKYIAPSHRTAKELQEKRKPGYFASENSLIEWIRNETGTGEARNPITYLVEASDDIVYCVVDIEDGVKKGVITWKDIVGGLDPSICAMAKECLEYADKGSEDEIKAQRFRISGIWHMVPAVIETFQKRYDAIMRGEYHGELITDPDCEASCFVTACKQFARKNVYTNKETLRLEVMGRQVIHDLMNIFWEGASDSESGKTVKEFSGKIHGILSSNYRVVYNEALKVGVPPVYCQRQLLTDYICGMTDTFACTLHKRLYNG